jgi:hypothetical protein
MRTRSVTAAVALGTAMLALAGAAACGRSGANSGVATAGGKTSASAHPSASVDREEQARAFAQCMRDHGVDMPDPDTNGGPGGPINIKVSGGPSSNMDAAMEACKDKLPNGGNPPSMDPQQQEQLRAFAQCMRDHGVDMPDPDPNAGGLKITKSGGPNSGGVNPDDPTFQAAQQACQDKLPGALRGGTTQNGGGGSGPGFSIGGGK